MITRNAPARTSFAALGTTATLLVTDTAALEAARGLLAAELARVDEACSRFRPDSELSRVNAAEGATTSVGVVFGEVLDVALSVAAATGGAVDPTVGASLTALGYDRSFPAVSREDPRPVAPPPSRADWRAVSWDPATRAVRLPAGVALDFGATAKAFAADRAAAAAAEATGCGVLINLGGDIAVAGRPPARGWRVMLADDHRAADGTGPVITIHGGGLATSGTTVRTWRRAGRRVHHIVDPATGDTATPVWRTVSVVAATCVEANAATTAAVVLGERALRFLGDSGLAARLAGTDGRITRLSGWPPDTPQQVAS
ncbi:FAD:protein FMN transferase [Streptomyces sp. SL13]|uniref:FAD:protein FMN transferase n=1 Tax=Streptantibioticus silvisoli TaxID=2705255 RepID=A0AA90HCG4_9ACTN|nr:FAD:protein FMN transferase [Streptantibioticus silvisoli]MDI5974089.1 FAD:protein FMN transferase [Streptantibioticus silvisoli]